VVQDILVSSKHLLLSMDEAGTFFVEDLNSTNGTWVGESLLRNSRQAISLNTLIKIGDTVLEWQNYFLASSPTPEVQTPLPENIAEPVVAEIVETPSSLPTPSPTLPKTPNTLSWLLWLAIGMGAFFVFILLFWYFTYVRKVG
jgi:pSer/pThr/pTyr-binding forkhead associated (FHA) protein